MTEYEEDDDPHAADLVAEHDHRERLRRYLRKGGAITREELPDGSVEWRKANRCGGLGWTPEAVQPFIDTAVKVDSIPKRLQPVPGHDDTWRLTQVVS